MLAILVLPSPRTVNVLSVLETVMATLTVVLDSDVHKDGLALVLKMFQAVLGVQIAIVYVSMIAIIVSRHTFV